MTMETSLPPSYEASFDTVGRPEWESIIKGFDDATIYQTWSYGAVRWGPSNLSHAVVRSGGRVAAAAQARIVSVPLIGRGIAYVTWGPFWRSRGEPLNADHIRATARALRHEYTVRRRLLLRLLPNAIEGDDEVIRTVLQEEGYVWSPSTYRSILLDLRPPLEDLNRVLVRSAWRNGLNFAKRQELNLIEGSGDDLYRSFLVPYGKMLERKRFAPGMDAGEFGKIQKDLPPDLKMHIVVCEHAGVPVASVLGSIIGETGIFLLGGASEEGRKLKATYLIVWRMIERMKEAGARMCDLGGYNPDRNPGTGHFKGGFAGRDIRHVGQFEACVDSLSALLVRAGDRLRGMAREALPMAGTRPGGTTAPHKPAAVRQLSRTP